MNAVEEQLRLQLFEAEGIIKELRETLSASEAREAHAKETMAGVALKLADALQKIAEAEALLDQVLEMDWDGEGSQSLTDDACDLLKRIRDHRYLQRAALKEQSDG